MPGAAVYAATKAYAASFSEALWWEFKPKNVFVLGFNPGATTSSFHTAAGSSKEAFPNYMMQSPEAVAQELARALRRRGSPRAVSGGINRLLVWGLNWLPRRLALNIMGGRSPLPKG